MWRGSKQEKETKAKAEEYLKKEETQFTHFVSIPLSLNDTSVQLTYSGFRETLLSNPKLDVCQKRQLHKGNFTHPSMLHLTVLQLDLGNNK